MAGGPCQSSKVAAEPSQWPGRGAVGPGRGHTLGGPATCWPGPPGPPCLALWPGPPATQTGLYVFRIHVVITADRYTRQPSNQVGGRGVWLPRELCGCKVTHNTKVSCPWQYTLSSTLKDLSGHDSLWKVCYSIADTPLRAKKIQGERCRT